MIKPKVGIVGYGVVGRSLHALLGDSATVLDVNPTQAQVDAVNACAAAFVCVPTPMSPSGQCDTSIVEACVQWLRTPLIVIRSTVAPGTTDRLVTQTGKRIVFQPEYLGETTAHPMSDIRSRTFIVLGGKRETTSNVADIYNCFLHSEMHYCFCSALAAELAKYMENSFLAAKVTFCNEFFGIAQALGVDYNELREVWLADPRIGRDHTFVYPDNRGFSGKCLPKDVSAIIASSRQAGYSPRLLEAIMEINRQYRSNDPSYDPNRLALADIAAGGQIARAVSAKSDLQHGVRVDPPGPAPAA
jgi:UDPglucose 6-dehydrogenase